MKPPPFRYARPTTLAEVFPLLADEDARVLAGGQSLVPMMNFRLARPSMLVDLAAIPELRRIEVVGDRLVLGAMVRQREAERSPVVAEACPLLVEALGHIGHVQIRNRGTIGGSLAHADPAAELPVVALALGAELVAASATGRRVIPAEAFVVGAYVTSLAPGEVLVEVRFPIGHVPARWVEVARRHGDFALAGVAAATVPGTGEVRVAMTGSRGPVLVTGDGPADLGGVLVRRAREAVAR